MNPYARTAEEMKRQSEEPKRFAKTAIPIAATVAAASFAPMLARAAPFLSQYIPEDLAIKGLSKISPKFGKFVSDAINDGYGFDQVKDFIGEQITQSQKQENPKQDRNPIQQYSPELFNFMKENIDKGRPIMETAAKSKLKFRSIIEKMEKDHKVPWSAIVETVFGKENAKKGIRAEEAERFRQQYGQPEDQMQQGAQQPQQGQGQQAIMAVFDKIMQM